MSQMFIGKMWEALTAYVESILTSPAMESVVKSIDTLLYKVGVPKPHPSAEQVLVSFAACILTLVGYYVFFGKRHYRKRLWLQNELAAAKQRVTELEEKLVRLEYQSKESGSIGKEVRIWMDGAFDMMHYGHMNAFRQGRSLGTYLIVGVNSDETITQCKGAPVMNDMERLTSVEGCAFVDEVVAGVPYIMNEEYLQYVIDKYKIDYVVHGDDPCIVDGKDVYESAVKMGKYRTIPRTEGISTTDIVGRMLLMSRSHHSASFGSSGEGQLASDSSLFQRKSNFLTTSHMIRLFSVGVKAPAPNARIVYLDGSWDMLNAGDVSFLKQARQFGDYVIVGVHNDTIVNGIEGANLPIMNLHERVLSLLGCKYVDDVLIDAPYVITVEMIASLKIGTVVVPVTQDGQYKTENVDIRYKVPLGLGILSTMEVTWDLSVHDIIDRIQEHNERFKKKYEKKKLAEDEYYQQRYNLHCNGTEPETLTNS